MHSWIKAISGAIVAQRGPGRSANTVGSLFSCLTVDVKEEISSNYNEFIINKTRQMFINILHVTYVTYVTHVHTLRNM